MALNLVAARPALVAACLLAALGACGGASEPASPRTEAPREPTPSLPESTPAAVDVRRSEDLGQDPEARSAVYDAVANLVARGTGTFSVRTGFVGSTVVDDGRYDYFAKSWELARHVEVGERESTTRFRYVGRESWFRDTSTTAAMPPWHCWVTTESIGDLAAGLRLPAPAPAPPALVAASRLVGRERTPGGFVGTTDLVAAVQLTSNKLLMTGELSPDTKVTVPVDVWIADHVIASMTLRQADLFTAFVKAGLDVPLDSDEIAALPGETEVTFNDTGKPVNVDAPAEQDVGSSEMDCMTS